MVCLRKVVSVGTLVSALCVGSTLLCAVPAMAQQMDSNVNMLSVEHAAKNGNTKSEKGKGPLTEKELIKLVKHNKKHLADAQAKVEAQGLGFEVTPEIEKSLQKAGADEKFIADVKDYTPSARAKKDAEASTAIHVSPAESAAYNQLKGETDPDARIQEANTFAQNFPNSRVLPYVYAIQAFAYEQKNDNASVIASAEKSLALDPNNLMALLLASSTLALPQMLNVPDAEKVQRLNKAEIDATKALQQITVMEKQPNETDAAFQKRQDLMASGAYASLGMVHLQRARLAIMAPDLPELGKAEQNYKTAIQKSQGNGSAIDYFWLGVVYSMENKVDDAIEAFTNAKKLAQGSSLAQSADQQINNLKAKKSKAAGS